MSKSDRSCQFESDSDLLKRFVLHQDQEAFESLLNKHASLVLGVCVRVLRHRQDAEDAFQATFLILARRAASIRHRHSIASWLYRVAHRAALSLAKQRVQQIELEMESELAKSDGLFEQLYRQELQANLDQEISQLPPRFQAPVVLCYLQRKTRAEAAVELRSTEAAVKSNLARARKLLRVRLARRGISLTIATAAFSTVLKHPVAVSAELVQSTASLCTSCLTLDGTSSLPSQTAANLAGQGVRKMVLTSLIKPMIVAGLIVLAVAAGTAIDKPQDPVVSSDSEITTVVDSQPHHIAQPPATVNAGANNTVARSRPFVPEEINSLSRLDDRQSVIEAEYLARLAEAKAIRAEAKKWEAKALEEENDPSTEASLRMRQLNLRAEQIELQADSRRLAQQAELLKSQIHQPGGRTPDPKIPHPEKQLAPGDRLLIEVGLIFNASDPVGFRREVMVLADGSITLPIVGQLSASNKNLADLGKDIHRIYCDGDAPFFKPDTPVMVSFAGTSLVK